MSGPSLKITQVRSAIGSLRSHRETLRSLGLRRIRQCVLKEDSPQVRGMIATVRHLVAVEEVPNEVTAK
ncbi:MAG: 50S ribosomal protein L30 [Pseudonocardiales bacterium]|nr:50S ribosomal protein L30 [Pseudonocardiales bacterium]MBV9029593.1 50S ribosomal protein L30 [Pseudonocardiales bacterium]MBW0011427.1 50S ribosomal protein L30 [Pseudonocardiales bacterium]